MLRSVITETGAAMSTTRSAVEESVWQAHRDALRRFVMPRVNDESVADDIVQQVLATGYARQITLRDPSKLRSWLYQITRNAIIDYYRSRKTTAEIPGELEQASNRQKENNRAEAELAQCLVPLIDSLPEPHRRTLILAELDGAKQREIASQMGLSLTAAKSRVRRARKMLRELLLKCCRVELDRRGGVVNYERRDGGDHA